MILYLSPAGPKLSLKRPEQQQHDPTRAKAVWRRQGQGQEDYCQGAGRGDCAAHVNSLSSRV